MAAHPFENAPTLLSGIRPGELAGIAMQSNPDIHTSIFQ